MTAPSDKPTYEPAGLTSSKGERHVDKGVLVLALGAIGVVCGDIGTSPLYAMREALAFSASDGLTRAEVLGLASLIVWALILVVTVKYVLLVLRFDNRGEGGTLSLLALAQSAVGRQPYVVVTAVVGAALFFGDAAITPAISVLSAVEGLNVVTPALEHLVVPVTVAILICLFYVQQFGTAHLATWFGPIICLWFVVLAFMGLSWIIRTPEIFYALDPRYGIDFLVEHGAGSLTAIGLIFLAVTGAEALYTDLGHFGRKPIQFAWLGLALPALCLNYLGQAALVLNEPSALEHPFFHMVPEWSVLPLVGLATMATVIASQAVITGAFSITRQAIQLGLLQRLDIRHTSERHEGQIYLPAVNWLLLATVIMLVITFGSAKNLAAAYGIAVSGDMLVTTVMASLVLWKLLNKPMLIIALMMAPFAIIEASFVSANLLKVFQGGYVPLLFAAGIVTIMWTWIRGARLVTHKMQKLSIPLDDLVAMLAKSKPMRVQGTAIFLTPIVGFAPSALLHNLKHNKVLHEQNLIVTIQFANVPRVSDEMRVEIHPINDTFKRIVMRFGYMENADVPKALESCRKRGIKFDIMSTSIFLSRRIIVPHKHPGMPRWQRALYIVLSKLALRATDFYRIPSERAIELGQQIAI